MFDSTLIHVVSVASGLLLAGHLALAEPTQPTQPTGLEPSENLKPVPSPPVGLQPLNLASEAAGAALLLRAPDGRWVDARSSSGAMTGDVITGFITADPAQELELSAGKHEFLLKLNGLRNINRLSARLRGEGSSLRAYIADAPYGIDSSRWIRLPGPEGVGDSSTVDLDFPFNSAQCVRLSVEVPNGGRIGSLTVLGDVYVDPYAGSIPAPENWDNSQVRVEYDFARSSSGGRVSYVESGSALEAFKIVDDDLSTSHKFDVADQDAFFIVELAENYPVFSASLVTTEPLLGAEVWTFSDHPANYLAGISVSAHTGELTLAKQQIGKRKPTGRVIVPELDETTLLTMPLPDSTARYMLVRVIGREAARPIEVSMFSVLGRVPRDVLPGFSRQAYSQRPPIPEIAEPEIVEREEIIDPPLLQPVSP